MQVSWIEPEEVRALAALLHGTTSTGTGGGWDVQTLPDAAQPLLPQGPEPATATAAASPSQPAPPQPQSPSADVVLIREKLRVIRDRAKQAGLIQDEPPVVQSVPAPAAPLDAPMAPPARSPLSQLPPLASLRPETAHTAPAAPVQAPTPPTSAPSSDGAAAPAFLPLEGAFTERLENFARWASKLTGSTEVLLADDHGDLLWGSPSHPSLVVSAMLAVQQALRASAGSPQQPPNLLQIPAGDLGSVQVLPCSTRFGLVTLILVNALPSPLAEASAAGLREALIQSVEVGGS